MNTKLIRETLWEYVRNMILILELHKVMFIILSQTAHSLIYSRHAVLQ